MKKRILKYIEKNISRLAYKMVKKHNPEIFAITGSFAKTTTKELVFEILRTKYGSDVRKSYGNLNTEIGLPLSIFGYKSSPSLFEWPFVLLKCNLLLKYQKKYPKFLVLEMAADKIGDIDYLCQIAPPKYGLITVIAPAHLEQFKTVENIALEKSKLLKYLPAQGAAFLYQGDPKVKEMSKTTIAKVIYFDGPISEVAKCAAQSVGQFFEIPRDKVEEAIENYEQNSLRLNTINLKNNIFLFDDSYNANPLSMEAAFENFTKKIIERKDSRRIAVLGDMLELGSESDLYHQGIGKLAHQIFDSIIGVGKYASNYNPDKLFNSFLEAEQYLIKEIKPGDSIFVKGSHGIRLDNLSKELIKVLGKE